MYDTNIKLFNVFRSFCNGTKTRVSELKMTNLFNINTDVRQGFRIYVVIFVIEGVFKGN